MAQGQRYGQPFTQQQQVEAQALAEQFNQENAFFPTGQSQMSAVNNDATTEIMQHGDHNYDDYQGLSVNPAVLSPALSSNGFGYTDAQSWPQFPTGNNSYSAPVHVQDQVRYYQELRALGQQSRQQPSRVPENRLRATNFAQSTSPFGRQSISHHQPPSQPQQYAQSSNLTYHRVPHSHANQPLPDGQSTSTAAVVPNLLASALEEPSFPTRPLISATTNRTSIPKQHKKKPAQLQSHPSTSVPAPAKTPKRNHSHKFVKQSPGLNKTGAGIQKPRKASASSSRPRGHSGSLVNDADHVRRKLLTFLHTNGFTWPQVKDAYERAEETNPIGDTTTRTIAHGLLSIPAPSRTTNLSPAEIEAERQRIVTIYSGYQKESPFRERAVEQKYKCTMGCGWSDDVKSNWERHERTHYPPEIWLCSQPECLEKIPKNRVSLRKDLARRHFNDHHYANIGADITGLQLEALRIPITDSKFPRTCVFLGCDQHFTTYDERKKHIEGHWKSSSLLDRGRIIKHLAENSVQDDEEEEPEEENDYNDDLDGRYDDDDDSDDDDGYNDQDGGTGGAAGMGGNPGNNHSEGGPSSYTNDPRSQQQQPSQMNNNTMGGYGGQYYNLDGLDDGYMPGLDQRPWKTTKSLRLQLLPQVFARGIAQTPIVLKKIQLQAALLLDLSSARSTQVVDVLRREVAMMAGALPSSPSPSIRRFPRLTAMTKLLPGLAKSVSKFDMALIAKQNQAILKFADLSKNVSLQELEDPGGLKGNPLLQDRLAHFEGGHIYHCFCKGLSKSTAPVRPSRLLHVGTKNNPELHLDTSEALPSCVSYCSLSHCWDDGYGLYLSTKNVTSLKHAIPPDDLTQSFHVAINIARDKGLEYLWIDTLCIMLDSAEDIQAEAPRITQIHASATLCIVVTSVAYDGDATEQQSNQDSMMADGEIDWNEKSEEPSEQDMSDLALTHSVEMMLPDESEPSGGHTQSEGPAIFEPPQRRDSHQLESFLAEAPKRSFFSAFPSWNKTSLTLPSLPSASLPPNQVEMDGAADTDETSSSTFDKPPSRIENYLDKWRFQWQRISGSKSAPVSSAASIVTSESPVPSVSDKSAHSGKRRSLMADLPVAFEKLFRGLRIRSQQHAESSTTPDG